MSNGCCITLLKTPDREKNIEYSKPVMVALPCGVYILKSRLNEFKPFMDKSGAISLKKLFEESKMKMGISSGRKYTPDVNDIIQNNPNSKKIIKRYDKNVSRNQLMLLAAERGIDYVIEFPTAISWLNLYDNIVEKMKYIPIKETDYVMIYIGCTKNDWGKKVISKINHFLDAKCLKEYKQRYQKFLLPEERIRHNEVISKVMPELSSD